MTIAIGRSIQESERASFKNGFYELFEAVMQSNKSVEDSLKSTLENIMSDNIDKDEKYSLSRPYIEALEYQKERDIRIRNTMLIAIYSYFETSLNELTFHTERHRKDESYIRTYLRSIFGNDHITKDLETIDVALRPLRNIITHGGIKTGDLDRIDDLIKEHPEFSINRIDQSIYISSYSGLRNILDFISNALDDVELYIRKKISNDFAKTE